MSSFLLELWEIDPHALQIYFSGLKGFHLLLDARLFGRIAPSKHLPTIFDSIRRHLALELPEPLRETVDLSIKDRVRLLRLPNTLHEKSKLYKIILSPTEIENLNPEQIRELASTARPLRFSERDRFGFACRYQSESESVGIVQSSSAPDGQAHAQALYLSHSPSD